MMRVLLVEDDPLLGDGLAAGLRQTGCTVDWLTDGQTADRALQTEAFDAVVLDLGLPRLSGMELLQRLRGRGADTPVLILTAQDALGDKIKGLDAGADDYLIEPIDLDELAARLRALRRRSGGARQPAAGTRRANARPGRTTSHACGAAGGTCPCANSPSCKPCLKTWGAS